MILFLQRHALTFSIFIFFPPKVAFFLVHSHCHLLCCMCAHHEIDWLHDGWWQTYFSMSAVNCRNLSTAESSTVLEDVRIIQFPDQRTSTLTLLYESTLSLSWTIVFVAVCWLNEALFFFTVVTGHFLSKKMPCVITKLQVC